MTMEQVIFKNITTGKDEIELQLPTDPNAWTPFILEHFTQRFIRLAQYPMELQFYKINAEKGYAIGSIIVRSEDNQVSIPVLIRNFKLLPIDLVIYPDNSVDYLDEDEVIQFLEGPRVFRGLAKMPSPADLGYGALPRLPEQKKSPREALQKLAELAPFSKVAQLKALFKKKADEAEAIAYHHPIFKDYVDFIKNLDIPSPEEEKELLEGEIQRNVFQIKKHPSKPHKYLVKAGNTEVWNAVEFEADPDFLIKIASLLNVKPNAFIEFVNKHSVVTVSLGEPIPPVVRKEATVEFKPANMSGKTYLTVRKDNGQRIYGNIYKMIDGSYCFVNDLGYVAFSPNGFRVMGELNKYLPIPRNTGVIAGETYLFVDENNKVAFGPVTILKKELKPECTHYTGRTSNGYSVEIHVVSRRKADKTRVIICEKDGNVKTEIEAKDLIPVKINQIIDIPLADEEFIVKYAGKGIRIEYNPSYDEFIFHGLPKIEGFAFNKNAGVINIEDNKFNIDDAMFLLAHRYSPKDAAKILKLAMKNGSVWVENFELPKISIKDLYKENINKAKELLTEFSKIKPDWQMIKTAALMDDTETMDAILGLNLVGPENFAIFIQYLPLFVETRKRLAKLLLLARLGVFDFPEEDIKDILVKFNRILEALKAIQFQLAAQQQQ